MSEPTPEELQEFVADLTSADVSGRNAMDRYKEFRQVFLGSDAGKRVLYDILALAHVWKSSVRLNPYATYAAEGERRLAIKILGIIHREPAGEKPGAGRNKPKE